MTRLPNEPDRPRPAVRAPAPLARAVRRERARRRRRRRRVDRCVTLHRHRRPRHRLRRRRRGDRRHARRRRARRSRSSRKARGSTPTPPSRSRSTRWSPSTATAGSSAALGRPAIAYAEGRCVGGSTEINSGLYHRLPAELAERVAARVRDRRVRARRARPLRRPDRETSSRCRGCPGAPPRVVGGARAGRGQARLAGGRVLPRVPLRAERPRGEADDGAHAAAAARSTPARSDPRRLPRRRAAPRAATGSPARGASARATRRHDRAARRSAPTTCSCAAARPRRPRCCSAAASARNIGSGLKMHPTVKIAARFPHPIDHGDVPMHRVTEFAPCLTIGGSASRRGHVALALADSARRLRRRARRLGAASPSTTPRSAARAPAVCSRCPVSRRRSSPTTSPKAT